MPCYHDDVCDAVSPLAWAGPEDGANSHERRLGLPAPCMGSDVSTPISRPAKKQASQRSFHKDDL